MLLSQLQQINDQGHDKGQCGLTGAGRDQLYWFRIAIHLPIVEGCPVSLDRRYIVAPVHKSMQLIDALVNANGTMTLSELAASTALPKTSAFRYLYTLRASGFVDYDERAERYSIGPRVSVPLPLPAMADHIRTIAQPAMLRLQRQFNETVNLGIRDGSEIVYIDMVGSSRLLHAEARIGKRDPLYSTALGKAILLTLGASEIDRVLPHTMLARTPHTITNRAHFLDDISRSAARHYALDMEENELGARCVAAAISEPSGDGPQAAISISGPAQLMTDDTLARIGRVLASTANSIGISCALRK